MNNQNKINQVVMEMQNEYASNSPYIDSINNNIQVLTKVPVGNIDKTIPGAGLTTLALESDNSVIILTPSKELIRNKVMQYPNEKCQFYILGIDGDIKPEEINDWIFEHSNQPIKIMVTYDGIWKVNHLLSTCQIIVDEADKLLGWSPLKSKSKKDLYSEDVMTRVYSTLKMYSEQLSFITATPTPLKYLPEWVSELPQIKMTWKNVTKAKPTLMKRGYPYKALKDELITPMNKNGQVIINNIVIKKAIIFINSVTAPVKMLEELDIEESQVGFIVGDTVKNDINLGRYSRITDYFNLPKYTFVTSSGFAGIDLKDNEAVNIVVSSVSNNWSMIDMTTDVRQAISRQRNKDNPYFDKFVFIYNNSLLDLSEEELTEATNTKKADIIKKIQAYEILKNNSLLKQAEDWAGNDKDFLAYTAFNRESNQFELNENLFNADLYFLQVIYKQYTNGFDIKGQFESYDEVKTNIKVWNPTYRDVASYLSKQVKDNPKINVDEIDWKTYSTKTQWIQIVIEAYKLYGKVFHQQEEATNMIEAAKNKSKQVKTQVFNSFNIGQRYARSEVKLKMNEIYTLLNIKRTAKHSDVMEFYNVKEIKVMGERMIEILSTLK